MMTEYSVIPGLHTTGCESNENVGVQPLGCGCENITLHPELVGIAPTFL